MRLTPTTLRERSYERRRAAENETDLETKRKLAGEALALAQLADQLAKTDCFVSHENIERYKAMLAGTLDDAQRQTIEQLLKQEQAKAK